MKKFTQKRLKSMVFIMMALIFSLPMYSTGGSKTEQIDALMKHCHQNEQFCGTVLVAENGKVIYKNAFGMANREWEIANTPDTRFRIGSMSKSFTAMLVMQLAREGKLKLEDNISRHLEFYRKDTGGSVTIYHLLTHTSGIPSGAEKAEYFDKSTFRLKSFIKEFCSGDLEFEPGTRFKYSNTGYIILGGVIESVTQKSYEEVLKTKILEPLGMKNSGFDRHEIIIKKRASGYQNFFAGCHNAPYLDTSGVHAAGAIYSTVEDLFLWDQALYSGKLLSEPFKKTMFTPYQGKYACGWWIMDRYVGHSGGINGFQSRLLRFVKDKNTIILLSNSQFSKLKEISRAIEAILADKPWHFPKISMAYAISKTILKEGIKDTLQKLEEFNKKKKDRYYLIPMEFCVLGDFLLKKKEIDTALAIITFNRDVNPDVWYICYQLGRAYKLAEKKDFAMENFKKALKLYPHKERSWYNKISAEIKELTEKK